MIRRGGALVAVLTAVIVVCSCRDSNRAPWAPSLPPAFGARIIEGRLQVWTGSQCVGVTRFALSFEPSRAELVLVSPSQRGVDFDHVTVGGPYPEGLEVSQALPEGFDWRSEVSMSNSVYGGANGWGTSTDLAEVVEGSGRHPDDTYWFQDVGWLNPADVAAQDGKTFLATCTPDPAKGGHR